MHKKTSFNFGQRPTLFCLLTQLVGMASKSIKVAENVYAPLMMVLGKVRTLAGKRVHHNGSIDTNFDPPQFPLDSTFRSV
jgi:hypothetical protein